QALTAGVDPQHRSLPFGRIAASAHVIRSQPRLIAPLDLRALLFGACGDNGVLLVKPPSHRRGGLLVGLLQGFLRRVSPTLEILADIPDFQSDAVTGGDELPYGLPR